MTTLKPLMQFAGVVLLALTACAPRTPAATPIASAPIVTFAATEPSPATPAAVVTVEAAVATVADTAPATTDQPTLSPTATPAPAGPIFTQLTTGGCCVQPFFSPDGAHVLYLDRPTSDAPVGIYGVPIDAPLSEPTFRTDKLGPFSANMAYSADLVNGQTFVEGTNGVNGEGERFGINNGGRSVSFAPDNQTIAWTVGQDSGNFDVRGNEIWVAKLDGSDAKRMITRYGGGIVAWFNDSQHMLIGGKAARNDAAPTLSILDLRDGNVTDVYSADRMRGYLLSPDNRTLVFFIAQAQDEITDGTYLLQLGDAVSTTAPLQPQRLDFFGAYRWRDATHLLYIPLKLNLPSHELWQLNVTTGQSQLLIPASTESQFKVGNGDWDVAPNGNLITYVNARDRNIWLAALPNN